MKYLLEMNHFLPILKTGNAKKSNVQFDSIDFASEKFQAPILKKYKSKILSYMDIKDLNPKDKFEWIPNKNIRQAIDKFNMFKSGHYASLEDADRQNIMKLGSIYGAWYIKTTCDLGHSGHDKALIIIDGSLIHVWVGDDGEWGLEDFFPGKYWYFEFEMNCEEIE